MIGRNKIKKKNIDFACKSVLTLFFHYLSGSIVTKKGSIILSFESESISKA